MAVTRALVVGVVAGLLAACPPNLEEGRAYRCTPGGGAAQCEPWVCRLDGYCHDPAAGEALPCAEDADCGGGWFCGKDAQCHDPALPAPLPCDDDTQCAGGWRCNTEGTCVDPGPAVTTPRGAVEGLVRLSPLLPRAELVAVSPAVATPPRTLTTVVATLSGGRVRTTSVETEFDPLVPLLQVTSLDDTAADDVVDLALSGGVMAITTADGGSRIIHATSAGNQVLVQFADTRRFRPLPVLAPDDGTRAIAALNGAEVKVVGVGLDGGFSLDAWARSLGTYRDVTSTNWKENARSSLDIPLLALSDRDLVLFRPTGELVWSTPYRLVSTPELGYEYSPLGLRATERGFAVAFEKRRSTGRRLDTWVSAVPWLDASGDPAPTLDGGPVLLTLTRACPEGTTLADFAVVPTSPGAVAGEVVCRSDGDPGAPLSVIRDGRPLRQLPPGVLDGRTAGVHAYVSAEGHLALGEGLATPSEISLARLPQWMAGGRGGTIAGTDQLVYGANETGLVVSAYAAEPDYSIEAVLEVEPPTFLYRQGAVARHTSGRDEAEGLFFLDGVRTSNFVAGARLVARDGGEDFIGTMGDALFAGSRTGNFAVASAATRPAPGFDITAFDMTTATDAGVYEAWVVANSRLFRAVARSVERWTSSELPLRSVEPLAIWYDGPRAFLGTRGGQVLQLPERVPVSAALGDGVTSMVGVCGTAVALREGALFQLAEPGDGGLWAWRPVARAAWVPVADGGLQTWDGGRRDEPGRLYTFGDRAWVASTTGLVYALTLQGCSPR